MNEKEIRQTINDLAQKFAQKRPNASKEDIEHMILDLFFQMYCEDKMDREDLSTLCAVMGYEAKQDILDQIEKDKENIRKGAKAWPKNKSKNLSKG